MSGSSMPVIASRQVTVILYCPPGADWAKVRADAVSRSAQGEVVLVHHHSARDECSIRGYVQWDWPPPNERHTVTEGRHMLFVDGKEHIQEAGFGTPSWRD